MGKDDILVFMIIFHIIINGWLLTAVCLTKIISEGHYSNRKELMLFAWIPFLNLSAIADIMKMGFFKVLGILILIIIPVRIADNIIRSGMYSAFSYLILSSILWACPQFFIWNRIAEEGKHNNHVALGILSGLPITSVFTIPYIAWKGRW